MTWAFVRPADPTVLDGRPLLDLGTGDGQTLAALTSGGLLVGLDASTQLLRGGAVPAVAGRAEALPFRDGSLAVVLAADLFHHLPEEEIATVLGEVARVLRLDGTLVAWWYEETNDKSPDAPRHARPLDPVLDLARSVGLAPQRLELEIAASASATVGLTATR